MKEAALAELHEARELGDAEVCVCGCVGVGVWVCVCVCVRGLR